MNVSWHLDTRSTKPEIVSIIDDGGVLVAIVFSEENAGYIIDALESINQMSVDVEIIRKEIMQWQHSMWPPAWLPKAKKVFSKFRKKYNNTYVVENYSEKNTDNI